MNLFMLAMQTGGAQGGQAALLGDSFAFLLLFSGAASMFVAGYLLYKAPKAQPQPARYMRRR